MLVRIPAAEWAKHVVNIDEAGTSGWDWQTPNGRNPFLNHSHTHELEEGSIIVNFKERARYARQRVAVYVLLHGPILATYSTAASDQYWSTTLAPGVRTLLMLPPRARCCLMVNKLLDSMARIPERANEVTIDHCVFEHFPRSRMIEHLEVLRVYYLQSLLNPEGATQSYMTAALHSFIRTLSQTLNTSPEEISAGINTLLEQSAYDLRATNTTNTALLPSLEQRIIGYANPTPRPYASLSYASLPYARTMRTVAESFADNNEENDDLDPQDVDQETSAIARPRTFMVNTTREFNELVESLRPNTEGLYEIQGIVLTRSELYATDIVTDVEIRSANYAGELYDPTTWITIPPEDLWSVNALRYTICYLDITDGTYAGSRVRYDTESERYERVLAPARSITPPATSPSATLTALQDIPDSPLLLPEIDFATLDNNTPYYCDFMITYITELVQLKNRLNTACAQNPTSNLLRFSDAVLPIRGFSQRNYHVLNLNTNPPSIWDLYFNPENNSWLSTLSSDNLNITTSTGETTFVITSGAYAGTRVHFTGSAVYRVINVPENAAPDPEPEPAPVAIVTPENRNTVYNANGYHITVEFATGEPHTTESFLRATQGAIRRFQNEELLPATNTSVNSEFNNVILILRAYEAEFKLYTYNENNLGMPLSLLDCDAQIRQTIDRNAALSAPVYVHIARGIYAGYVYVLDPDNFECSYHCIDHDYLTNVINVTATSQSHDRSTAIISERTTVRRRLTRRS